MVYRNIQEIKSWRLLSIKTIDPCQSTGFWPLESFHLNFPSAAEVESVSAKMKPLIWKSAQMVGIER